MSIEDVTSLSTELSVEEPKETVEAPAETAPEEKVEESTPSETIESLESLAEKTDDSVPLRKFMSEKDKRRAAEQKAATLEAEIAKLREDPYKSNADVKMDVSKLAEKHGIDEEVLADILKASASLTKEQVRKDLEEEFKPILAETAQIKKEKEAANFESKFSALLTKTLEEMPEYATLVDKDDIKSWVRSGQYSKLSLPQLIEQKYGRFIPGKKTLEQAHSSKTVEMPDTTKPLSDDDYLRLDKDPELRKKWADGLQDRLRKYM